MQNIDNLKQTYHILEFIVNKLNATQFYPEDFQAADKSLRFLVETGNKIADQIKELEAPVETASEEKTTVVS